MLSAKQLIQKKTSGQPEEPCNKTIQNTKYINGGTEYIFEKKIVQQMIKNNIKMSKITSMIQIVKTDGTAEEVSIEQ